MVDFPSTAKFLTPEEKNLVMWTQSTKSGYFTDRDGVNGFVPEYSTSSVGEEERFQVRHLVMAIKDWQLWLHILLFWSIVTPRKSHFHSNPGQWLIHCVSLRDLALPSLHYPGFRIFCRYFKPSDCSSIRRRE